MPPSVKRDPSSLFIPGAIVLAGIIIGISLIIALKPSQQPAAGGGQQVQANIKDVDLTGDPYIGDKNAPVTMAYWSDYQCPFCKAVEVGHPQIPTPAAIPDIIKDYVKTGKLKLVFEDYAFLGPDSVTAALYGRAVWELYPDRYYEWREAMYKAQDEEHGGFGDEASILQLTRNISGFDADKLKNLVAQKNKGYTAAIEADRAEGEKAGVSGTPGFLTGTTLIGGAVPINQFKSAIDAQL
jgi:protein-disulfide isomerase